MMLDKIDDLFFPHDGKARHVKALDGLRGIAVLIVLLSHTSNAKVFIHKSLNFAGVGKVGVYLFFVLSAYLLDRQIAIAFRTSKSSKGYWKNYALRRFLRIYPLFVVSLLLHGLFTLLGYHTVIDQRMDVPLHLLLVKGESIFWSIPVEFKYYLASPLIMWVCHKFLKWNRLKLLVFFATLVLSSMLVHFFVSPPITSTFRYLPIFMVGTAIATFEIIDKQRILSFIRPTVLTLLAAFATVVILLSIPHYFHLVFGLETKFHSSMYYLPYGLLWGVILLSAKYGNRIVRVVLENKILRFIGNISFSVYLFHKLALFLTIEFNLPAGVQFWVFLLLTLVFSSLTFVFIERPLAKVTWYKLRKH